MADHPCIMSAPMVCALIREAEHPGTGKTMTRRLAWKYGVTPPADWAVKPATPWQRVKPGDRLWVRERGWRSKNGKGDGFYHFVGNEAHDTGTPLAGYKAVPSIHMPRWASRLTLTVTAAREAK